MRIVFVVSFLALFAFAVPAAESYVADMTRFAPFVSAADKSKGPPNADYRTEKKDGVLSVEVKSLDNAVVKVRVSFDGKIAYAGNYMTLKTDVSGVDADGCTALFQGWLDRMKEGKDRKHYWRPSSVPVADTVSTWEKTRFYEACLEELTITFEIRNPGVYRFHRLEFCRAPDPMLAYEPGRNYIVNGGAEQGMYATSATGERAMRFGVRGGTIEPFKGRRVMGLLKPVVCDDPTFVRGGRNSFGLAQCAGGEGRLYFNPVPVVDYREFVFSFWVKSRKKTHFKTGVFVTSGASYEMNAEADGEWKKITLALPKWGERGDKMVFYGKVTGYGVAVPFVEPCPGTEIWVDDAFASVGVLDGAASYGSVGVASRTETLPLGVLRPDQPLKGTVVLRNHSPSPCAAVLECRFYDWRNRPVKSAWRSKKITLAAESGAKEYPFSIKPPKGLRGPMTLEWVLLKDGKVLESVSHYFGVQSADVRPDPRLSVNVLFGSPEQTLAFMKEFGVGAARLWGPCRNWDLDFGYYYTGLFKAAGIRNMFVMGVPNLFHDGKVLRHETLLPNDETEWFGIQAKLVEAHRGEVDVYEFLNEYNIWKGRLKNPDPSKFSDPTMEKYVSSIARFAPVLKRADPGARLAGCATCSTDLKFIGEFLESGGGKHVDMITEHAYSGNPDCPDYGALLDRGLALARRHGVKSWAQSEAGEICPNHLPPRLVDERSLVQMHTDLRNMIIAWAKGVESYSHFMLCTGRAGTDWGLTYLGNADNDWEDSAKPALFAFRTAAGFLAGAKCIATADLGGPYKAYVFDSGSRRIAVVWKWMGVPVELMPEKGCAGVRADWFDAMGNRLNAAKKVELSVYPVYCVTPASARNLVRALETWKKSPVVGDGVYRSKDSSDPNMLQLR